ncbi:MAG: tetratricopeptide repeat protein [Acidobacteria bacterium]|nr:tetratricopeptide repeat protein [Acidobacteriota bacterium]
MWIVEGGKSAVVPGPAIHDLRSTVALWLLLSLPLAGDSADKGWDHFYNLEYQQAIDTFEQVVAEAPEIPENYNYLAQAILYKELYRLGALESELLTGNNYFIRTEKIRPDPKANARFLQVLGKGIRLAKEKLAADPDNKEALYALGSAYGLETNYHFLVEKNWRGAVGEASLAKKYHNQVVDLDPGNYDAMLIQGVYDYAMGSLPWHARLLSYLIGRSGDKNRGAATIELVAKKGKRNRVDAQVMLAILYRREKKPAKAIAALEPLIRAYPRNYLFQMEKAHMYSDLGKKDEALACLRELEQAARRGSNIPLEKVYYAIGDVQFWYNDLEASLENMKQVTASSNLDLHTGVLAWMRRGQLLDLMGRRPEAVRAYREAIRFGPQTAAAEESKRYLSSPYKRKG